MSKHDPDYVEEEVTDSDTESELSEDDSVLTQDSEEQDDLTSLCIKKKELEIELKYERLNQVEKLKLYDFKLVLYKQYMYMYYYSLFVNVLLIVTHIFQVSDFLPENTNYLLKTD